MGKKQAKQANQDSITLYYANWCGHCHSFMPTWDALKGFFKQHSITATQYEDKTHPEEIKSAGVRGFPTIKINKNGKEYEYRGPRDADSLIYELKPDFQTGGGSVFSDYQEYRNYKTMYIETLAKMKDSMNY